MVRNARAPPPGVLTVLQPPDAGLPLLGPAPAVCNTLVRWEAGCGRSLDLAFARHSSFNHPRGPAVRTNITSGKVLVAGKPAPGLAIHGYDAVAYFTEGKPMVGDAAHAVVHQGATYRFASKANLEAFKTNPTAMPPSSAAIAHLGYR